MNGIDKANQKREWDPLEIRSLTAIVLDDLRKRILTGEFRPGERINESELATKLGISRSPVREAFRVLESEGLISTLPRKGSFITEISPEDVDELFDLREILECHAVHCIRRRAQSEPAEISQLIEKVSGELFKEPDAFSVISGFHFNLVELSNRYRLVELYKILGVSLRRYQLVYLSKKGQRDISLEHHKGIVDALKKGKYAETKKLLKSHIRYVENMVKKQIKEVLAD
jgi:DNA-binding GntR family transcriptional regulator